MTYVVGLLFLKGEEALGGNSKQPGKESDYHFVFLIFILLIFVLIIGLKD